MSVKQIGIELRPKSGSWLLEPETGVEVIDGVTYAVSLPYWLRLNPTKKLCKCRWVRIRYSAGFFDEPVRPLIRFSTRSGNSFVQPMNGAILGSAEWIGRIPDETVSISISPGRQLGPFSFRIDRIDVLSRPRLMQGGFFIDPLWALWAIRSRILDSRQEAWQSVKFALGGTPFDQYGAWAAHMARPFDPTGFDQPHINWDGAPPVRFITALDGSTEDLGETLTSLRSQINYRWSLHALAHKNTDPVLLAKFREEAVTDGRLVEISSADRAAFEDDDRIAVIHSGDRLPPYALGVIAEAFLKRPDLGVLYTDEDTLGQENLLAPILKPDWSPIFHHAIPFIGRLAFIRHRNLVAAGLTANALLLDEQDTLQRLLDDLDSGNVGHVRRILYHRKKTRPGPVVVAHVVEIPPGPEPVWPEVSIVIPTRDRFNLLAACVRGIKERTDYPAFNIVIVDNGSKQAKALALLNDLRDDKRFRVLERPEPFNYAKLSNEGARATTSPMLVFLNNDIRMINPRWLKAIVRLAMKPQVGVVGAKLFFPNGKIQHAGVVLGMGGISGHIYRRAAKRVSGYLQQAMNTREMMAVTGACIAIDRAKFEAVGGFDAENLPVDLNDMDLCLRVAERGWTNVWAADALLTHVQSASRGSERNPFDQYRQERAYFIGRWMEAIRDDPYFHPGFSLSAHRPVLA